MEIRKLYQAYTQDKLFMQELHILLRVLLGMIVPVKMNIYRILFIMVGLILLT